MKQVSFGLVLGGLALVGGMAPVWAQSVPEGIWQKTVEGTLVSLAADAHRKVPEDRLRATLSMEQDGKTAAEVQKAINLKMQEAQKRYAKYADVKATTGSYNVWQDYAYDPVPNGSSKRRLLGWKGSQQLVLDAPVGDKVLSLMGELQGIGFASQGMDYYLSREARDVLAEELTEEALKTIQARAKKMASVLGQPQVKFEYVNTTDSGGVAPPMMMRAMMAKDAAGGVAEAMPAPVGAPGETDVNVRVEAMVRIMK